MSTTVKFTTPPCQVCSQTSEFDLDPEKIKRWQDGAFAQDVFPEMSADTREQLISGTHPKCWDELFGDEEDYA